ncbi:ribonuclease H1-like [Sycon ciliatum]|uniref:ribonuclease H1-like n=1 Tax=Sycon ciliatum TaxID=27933 RepID=UPI0020AA9D52|eukprot:scpid72679/ scgid26942/ Ribonuclease H1
MPFYAVRHGASPGVYKTWDECKAQVNGFSGARYKKFSTMPEAMDFIEARDGVGRGAGISGAATRGHSVAQAHGGGGSSRFSLDQTVPIAKVKYAGKRSRDYQSDQPHNKLYGYDNADVPVSESDSDEDYGYSTPKKSNVRSATRATNRSASKTRTSNPREPQPVKLGSRPVVFVDGACSNNGNYGGEAKAGVGVHWPSGIAPDLREPLPGAKQSNQRAEMMAACRAMEQAYSAGLSTIEICSDSMYTIKGVNEWMANWKKRNWVTTASKPVENRDLWQRLDTLTNKVNVKWTHVRGHVGIVGNERADLLARQGQNAKQA